MTILGDASVAELGRQAGTNGGFDARRFRMLIALAGTKPHEEDEWIGGQVRIGEALLHVDRADRALRDDDAQPGLGQPRLRHAAGDQGLPRACATASRSTSASTRGRGARADPRGRPRRAARRRVVPRRSPETHLVTRARARRPRPGWGVTTLGPAGHATGEMRTCLARNRAGFVPSCEQRRRPARRALRAADVQDDRAQVGHVLERMPAADSAPAGLRPGRAAERLQRLPVHRSSRSRRRCRPAARSAKRNARARSRV